MEEIELDKKADKYRKGDMREWSGAAVLRENVREIGGPEGQENESKFAAGSGIMVGASLGCARE